MAAVNKQEINYIDKEIYTFKEAQHLQVNITTLR